VSRAVTGLAVGIPARDEAVRIEACLRSVRAAAEGLDVPVVVVVAADACDDLTVAIADAVLAEVGGPRDRVVVTGHRSVGAARSAALDAALHLLGHPPESTWLATTDADTVVDPTWLRQHLRWARTDADGVAGLVRVDWDGGPIGLPARYAESIAAGGTGAGHQHVHGANLGLIGSRWVQVGGCGTGPEAEDHELWRRLRRCGARVLGVDDLLVTTSGRLRGRAPHGFAGYLADLVDPALEDIA